MFGRIRVLVYNGTSSAENILWRVNRFTAIEADYDLIWRIDCFRAHCLDSNSMNWYGRLRVRNKAYNRAAFLSTRLFSKTRFSPFRDQAGYTIVMRWQRRSESHFLMTKRFCW